MNPELARRAHEVFKQSLDEPSERRGDFVDRSCAGDTELLSEVRSLLESAHRAGAFLETPASLSNMDVEPSERMIGRRIGAFTINSVIACGGMGTVFQATQQHPHRTVALKVMRGGLLSRAALRRFEFESQILARLQHPNIAQIYEAGTHDDGTGGVPYFAMEFVANASPITEHCDSRTLSLCERLQLFMQVCEAVHYGHQRGVIHRDLKPANILVDDQQRVKVIDFGVARASDADIAVTTQHTSVGDLIGTLPYMSPEQYEADPAAIDTRSDVYSLGVVLYELICGELPYDVTRQPVYEAGRIVREQLPRRLRTIIRSTPPDVETITLKALEKEADRRYQSAADLAHDLDRYLNNLPIEARPASMVYHARMFARRNRALVGAGTLAVALLLAGVAVSTMFAIGQSRARNQAEIDKTNAQRQAAIAVATVDFMNKDLLGAADPFFSPNPDITVREALDTASSLIEHRFSSEPHVEASVRSTLGMTYVNLGQYDKAQPHLERALELRRAALGDAEPETLASMHQLGWLRYHQLRYDEADQLLGQTLRGRQALLGPEHAESLDSMQMLASLWLRQGRFDEAEKLHKNAIDARRRVLGENHQEPLESLDGLARVYMAQGRYALAQPLYEQVLQASEQRWGKEHRFTLYATGNLARVHIKLARHAEAIQLLKESLAMARRILGDSHPDTLVYLGDLGSQYTLTNQHALAEPLIDEALQGCRRVHGEDHASTIACTVHLANLRRQQRRFDEAEAIFAPAIEKARTVLGDEHPVTLDMLNGFGLLRDAQGKSDLAVALYEQVLSVRKRTLGEDHPSTLIIAHNLAFVYGNLKRFAEAEALFQSLLDVRRRTLGDDHPDVALSLTNLGHVIRAQGRFEDAEKTMRAALEAWRKVPGPPRPFMANALVNLAGLLWQLQRQAESEPLLREALEIQRAALPENDPMTTATIGFLSDTLLALKNFEECEALLLELEQRLKDGAVAPRRRAYEKLVKLYEAWGKAEAAGAWRMRLAELKPDSP